MSFVSKISDNSYEVGDLPVYLTYYQKRCNGTDKIRPAFCYMLPDFMLDKEQDIEV